MNKRILLAAWAILFLLCAVLGFIPEPEGFVKALLTLLSIGFFVPPALLVWKGETAAVKLVRNLSIASLAVTLGAIVLNLVSVYFSQAVGTALYAILVIVSTPMICVGHWALSLFLWAFLMVWAVKKCRIHGAK